MDKRPYIYRVDFSISAIANQPEGRKPPSVGSLYVTADNMKPWPEIGMALQHLDVAGYRIDVYAVEFIGRDSSAM